MTDVVEVFGVKGDGSTVSLGTASIPPAMKRKDIAREMFGGSPEDDTSEAFYCLCALEQYHDWLIDSGWKAPTMTVIPPVVLNQ